jgi:DNA modification methylase
LISIHQGDMREWLRGHNGPLFDCAVTDPPYELGFMGKGWDKSGVAFQVNTWRAVYDQLKPGAHLVAFSGTRTYHRMACAIEDAGFEIRDQLAWTYGSGFPKSMDVSKAIDRAAGAEREVIGRYVPPNGKVWNLESDKARANIGAVGHSSRSASLDQTAPATDEAEQWAGWGTALKPAWEPICLARKPISEKTVAANVLKWGTGALNIDACRVVTSEDTSRELQDMRGGNFAGGNGLGKLGRIGGGHSEGRFPANLCHDGSAEVLAGFPSKTGNGFRANASRSSPDRVSVGGFDYDFRGERGHDDSGSAARFFYSAKAGPLDRIGTAHATVKPVDLMRWLCRMITPPGGHILEPFAGSGTTGIAAMAEGFDCTMIELMADHVIDIERKLAFLRGDGAMSFIEHDRRRDERAADVNHGPLFG